MPTSLRQQLNDLAATFANSVLQAIRTASIEDLLAESGGTRRLPAAQAVATRGRAARRTGRLARRSADDINGMIDSIVALLKQSPKGLRAEEIRQKLDLQAKEMPRPLKEAVAAGRLGKSGQKRATTYFVKGGGASAPKAGARARGPARKK